MKKSDIPEPDRKAAETLALCPYCHHPLRGLLTGEGVCDRWACWVTRTDEQYGK